MRVLFISFYEILFFVNFIIQFFFTKLENFKLFFYRENGKFIYSYKVIYNIVFQLIKTSYKLIYVFEQIFYYGKIINIRAE